MFYTLSRKLEPLPSLYLTWNQVKISRVKNLEIFVCIAGNLCYKYVEKAAYSQCIKKKIVLCGQFK